MRYIIPKDILINEVDYYLGLDVQHVPAHNRNQFSSTRKTIINQLFSAALSHKDDIICDSKSESDDERLLIHILNQQRFSSNDEQQSCHMVAAIRALQLAMLSVKRSRLYERDALLIATLREKTGFNVQEMYGGHIRIDAPSPLVDSSRKSHRNLAASLEDALNHKYYTSRSCTLFTVYFSEKPEPTLHIILGREAEILLDDSAILNDFANDILDPEVCTNTDHLLFSQRVRLSRYRSRKIIGELTHIPQYPLLPNILYFGQWHYNRAHTPRSSYIYTPIEYVSESIVKDIHTLIHDESRLTDDRLCIPVHELMTLKERMESDQEEQFKLRNLFHHALHTPLHYTP